MKNLFRKLVNALALVMGYVSRPVRFAAYVCKLSMARARLIMAQPRFWARVKSALTIPDMAYGAPYAQGGYTRTVNLLIAAVIAIFAIIIIIAYLVPQAYISSGNMTTSMTNAGASTDAIQWWKWLMWGGIVLVVLSAIMALIGRRRGRY